MHSDHAIRKTERSRTSPGICLWVLLQLWGAPAAAESHKLLLTQAVKLYHEGRLDRSLELLDRALARRAQGRSRTVDARVLGRIQLYRGLCLALSGRREQALAALGKALELRPRLRLSPDRFKPELVALLEQARRSLPGTLEITTNRVRARVLVDGKARGDAPLLIRLPAGRHEVQLLAPGGRRLTRQVVLTPGRTTRLGLLLEAPPSRSKPAPAPADPPTLVWTWVAAGGAAAALLAGGLVWVSADSAYEDLHQDFPRLKAAGEHDTIEQQKEAIQTQDVAATVLFCVAGTLAVTSAVLFFVERRGPKRRERWSARLVPVAGPTTGLVLMTHF